LTKKEKFHVKSQGMALYQDPNSFFSLGKKDTYDLFIADNCSKKRNSCSNLGQNYEIPESAD